MEWTVSTAKGVKKLSLTCRVICTWTWSRAVTSLYVRKALMEQNVSHCDFSADAGPRGSFHRENVSTGAKLSTQPAEPVWLWLTLTNKTKPAVSVRSNKTAECCHFVTGGLLKHTRAQSWFVFPPSHCITITTQIKWKLEVEVEKKGSTRNSVEVLFRSYIYTECKIVGAQ